MNLIKFLAMKLHPGTLFSSLQDEFREGRPKLVVAPETIDAVIARSSYDELNSICGDETPSRTSVYRGRNSLQDEFREGRPKLVVVLEIIDAVCQLILQDRHVIYH